MPPLIIYLLKLSLSLGLVYLFYHFVLRRLTFYTWNRWYLMGYSLLCFFLPFIDISLALEGSEIRNSAVVNWVPVIGQRIESVKVEQRAGADGWDYALLVLLTGVVVMLIRLVIQLISIRRMRNRSSMIAQDGIRIYHVDAPIIPFSFGDSIFINQQQHNTTELEEIIRHEFVHVKQNHSMDIIWGELICLLNWYNPFAWLFKKAIRQNLEFIADRHVLEQGMDRKQYQYLLLKVIGNNHFSIANQFNFSSLKKRIAMMNKLRTARIHLVRFLFILPLLSVMLLAFRSQWDSSPEKTSAVYAKFASIVFDKNTGRPLENVLITDLISKETTRSGSNGYFEMQFPIEGKREVKFSLEKEGYQQFVSSHVFDDKFTRQPIGVVTLWEMIPGNVKQFCTECHPLSFLNYAAHPELGEKEAREVWISYLQQGKNIIWSDMVNHNGSRVADTLPLGRRVNNKGYHVSIEDAAGNCMIVVKDKKHKLVKKILLTEWNSKPEYYEGLYGALPPPPPPPPADRNGIPVPGFPVSPAAPVDVITVQGYPIAPAAPAAPVDVKTVQGYPIAPAAPATPVDVVTVQGYPIAPASPKGEVVVTGYATPRPPVKMPEHVKSIKITNDNKAEVELKNGKTEKYDLGKPTEKAKFDAKYPAPPPPPPPPAKGVRVEGLQLNGSVGAKLVEGKPLPDNLIYVINGKVSTRFEMEQIKPDQIASVDILKGNTAVALYGDNAKDGVVQIKLKDEASPLYVIDGEIANKEKLDQIKPDQIESIDVLKGEKATTAYGDKGRNGVIVIRTKK